MDLLLAMPLLLLSVPLFIVVALAIRVESPGPAVFRQDRVGYQGKIFRIFKFRTMTEVIDAGNEHLLEVIKSSDPSKGQFKVGLDKRITRIGRILRKTSLDEIPQLLNVVLGHMSLVGPRPHTLEEVYLFPEEYSCRHEVPPGLTGLWQVSGRNKLNPLQMLELDVKYVKTASLFLDLRILAATIPAVFRASETE